MLRKIIVTTSAVLQLITVGTVAVGCGGGDDGGGGPTGPQSFALEDLIGLWNVTLSFQSVSPSACEVESPGTISDVWEFFRQEEGPTFFRGLESQGSIAFDPDGGEITWFIQTADEFGDPVNLLFNGQLTSRTRLSGTIEIQGTDVNDVFCVIRFSVRGSKFGS